jgi:hypothetical protein
MNTKRTKPTVGRTAAAEIIGVRPATLKAWAQQDPRRGPAFTKIGGSKQARTLYRVDEIERWKRDPVAYERRRQEPRP